MTYTNGGIKHNGGYSYIDDSEKMLVVARDTWTEIIDMAGFGSDTFKYPDDLIIKMNMAAMGVIRHMCTFLSIPEWAVETFFEQTGHDPKKYERLLNSLDHPIRVRWDV